MERLREKLLALDGKGYKSYKTIEGEYRFPDYSLSIDHVQGDPFAMPSRISIRLDATQAGLPEVLCHNRIRRTALEDYLGRAIKKAIKQFVKGNRGSGCSGEINIAISGQQVLVRNAVVLIDAGKGGVEARLTLGLPADNRRAAGHEAIQMFFNELPHVVTAALSYQNLDPQQLRKHVESVEDQQILREWLIDEGLVAFVADGSILPRASGVDDRPLAQGALPITACDDLARMVHLPNAGTLRGLAIPHGITLIVGGGFHGKSTLLQALERGVYNHIPGDGREHVATLANAVKVRAEDGRIISRVNISPFINNLPFGRDTQCFSTGNASGSTSQAANIIEALETGAELLLIDEDTSATNFMIRDERMQALVENDKEPITPLLHRVRELYEHHGISSVIVMGGSGDYFDVADTVIMMDNYEPHNVSARAKALAKPSPNREYESQRAFKMYSPRRPQQDVLNPARGRREVYIDSRETISLLYGEQRIDLSQVEQLIDIGQTRSIGLMIYYYSRHYADSGQNLIEGLKKVMADAEQYGLDLFSPYKVGNLALPRLYELAAAINRIRQGHWS